MATMTVFGASGRTGRRVAAEAVRSGQRVVAVCRRAEAAALLPGEAVVLAGDGLEPPLLGEAVAGAAAVVVVFGPRPGDREPFCAGATGAIVEAMADAGVRRLIVQTGAMVGRYPRNRSLPMRLAVAVYDRLEPVLARDREEQEACVRASGLDWTLVKPPRLTEAPTGADPEVGEDLRVGLLSSVARADLARVLVGLATTRQGRRRALFVRA